MGVWRGLGADGFGVRGVTRSGPVERAGVLLRFRLPREGVEIRVLGLSPSLWFEAVRSTRAHQIVRRSGGGSVAPPRVTSFCSGIQIGTVQLETIEMGSAVRSARAIETLRCARIDDFLRTPEWQRGDEKELRR
jgi:hypothetical protein